MTLKTIHSTLCDFHLEDGTEIDAPPEYHLTLSANGTTRELDLCETCSAQLSTVLNHALAVGTAPAVNGEKTDKRNLGAARDFECPVCHQWYISRNSLNVHARTAHDLAGAEWAELNPYAPKRKAPAAPEEPCPVCGYMAASNAGMAAHKRIKHPAPAPAKRRGRPRQAETVAA
jgi:hypothetical protein